MYHGLFALVPGPSPSVHPFPSLLQTAIDKVVMTGKGVAREGGTNAETDRPPKVVMSGEERRGDPPVVKF